MLGWLLSIFKGPKLHPGVDPRVDDEPTDDELNAVMSWMEANGINGEDFGFANFKKAPFLSSGATMIVVGEGNTTTPDPVGFVIEVSNGRVLTGERIHPTLFAEANGLAEKAYDSGEKLLQLVRDASAARAAQGV